MVYQVNRAGQGVPIRPGGQTVRAPSAGNTGGASFKQVFDQQVQKNSGLKFSAHAQERLRIRNIELDNQDVFRLEQGVNQLAVKGGRESLVLMDRSAFVVNVQNRTVITAIADESLQNNVFTNIDSAVIV